MFESAVIAVLIVLNGLFALSELAIVSARRSRLKMMAEAGKRGATGALALAADPGRFLSTVQIGITLIGIVAGAYSGAAFGKSLSNWLEGLGMPYVAADWLGHGLVIVVVTYFSLVIGELVPKHLALRNAEAIACIVAPAMTLMSRVASPVVSLLDASTRILLRLMGKTTERRAHVTEEEIKSLIAEAESSGVLEEDEQRLIVGVLRLGDRSVKGVMTPRMEVKWIDVSAGESEIRQVLIESPHSLLPVGEGTVDALLGVVQARELLASVLLEKPLDIRALLRQAPIIPDTMDALDVMARLRESDVKIALVLDEYGHFEGLVTPADLLETIGFASPEDAADLKAVRREDGSWLLSGWMPADEMADTLGIVLPARRDYQTVAGFVLSHFLQLPKVSESVRAMGWEFEVIDLDGRRIDKVLASRLPPTSRVRAQ